MNIDITFHPIFSYLGMLFISAVASWVLYTALHRKMYDLLPRVLMLTILFLICMNPAGIREIRKYLGDKVLVVLDKSDSMTIADRAKLRDKVLEEVKNKIKDAEVITIDASRNPFSASQNQTEIYGALHANVAALPVSRISGTVIITDGRVHDAPAKKDESLKGLEPINAVIIGNRDEFDYKLFEPQAPKYGMVGETVEIKIKAGIDGKSPTTSGLDLRVEYDGHQVSEQTVVPGEDNVFTFKLEHAGQNIFEFILEGDKTEITKVNNRQAVIVNGIRDRLKVLLVSGKPHMGERAWRNLLRSDPAVDLVHFTILRTPDSFDPTSSKRMSLIAFPVDELFSQKIKDFDLIIFDKYVDYGLLQANYFTNIANFVKNGGSFLLEMGSDKLEPSIFASSLSDVLPLSKHLFDQQILQSAYLPSLTEKGVRHAITSALKLDEPNMPEWNSQVRVNTTSGDVLMKGLNGNPLLIVDKVDKGRVAVLTSDNIWLWSKNEDTKAEYIELQRKLAHWLMKEPELEDGYIKITQQGESIKIQQRLYEGTAKQINVVSPDDSEVKVDLADKGEGWFETDFQATQKGLYKFYNELGSNISVVGYIGGKEYVDMTASDEVLKTPIRKSGGITSWYDGKHEIGINDISLKSKKAYQVTGAERISLFSNWIYIAIILIGFVAIWRRESSN